MDVKRTGSQWSRSGGGGSWFSGFWDFPDKHILIVPPLMNKGRDHPVAFPDSLPSRPMDPKKGLVVYGYGSVYWKDRMYDWKGKKNDKLQVVKHEGGGGDGDDMYDPDLPKDGRREATTFKKATNFAEQDKPLQNCHYSPTRHS